MEKKEKERQNICWIRQIRQFATHRGTWYTCDEFLGFICGIVSQDHDLQEMYLDSFITIAGLREDQLQHAIEKLDIISEKYNVKFYLSISKDEKDLPECAKAKVIVSL